MNSFQGKVHMPIGEFHTWQELILAAIEARTYSAVPAENTRMKQYAKDQWTATMSMEMILTPVSDIYVADAWKGVRNGVITQSAWVAADLTGAGGGKLYEGGTEHVILARVDLSGTVVYAALACDIDLHVTGPSE